MHKSKTHKVPSLDTLPWVRFSAKMVYQSVWQHEVRGLIEEVKASVPLSDVRSWSFSYSSPAWKIYLPASVVEASVSCLLWHWLSLSRMMSDCLLWTEGVFGKLCWEPVVEGVFITYRSNNKTVHKIKTNDTRHLWPLSSLCERCSTNKVCWLTHYVLEWCFPALINICSRSLGLRQCTK